MVYSIAKDPDPCPQCEKLIYENSVSGNSSVNAEEDNNKPTFENWSVEKVKEDSIGILDSDVPSENFWPLLPQFKGNNVSLGSEIEPTDYEISGNTLDISKINKRTYWTFSENDRIRIASSGRLPENIYRHVLADEDSVRKEFALNPNRFSARVWRILYEDKCPEVRKNLYLRLDLDEEFLRKIYEDLKSKGKIDEITMVFSNPNFPRNLISKFSKSKIKPGVLAEIRGCAANSNNTEANFNLLISRQNEEINIIIAKNPGATLNIQLYLAKIGSVNVQKALCLNPNLKVSVFRELLEYPELSEDLTVARERMRFSKVSIVPNVVGCSVVGLDDRLKEIEDWKKRHPEFL